MKKVRLRIVSLFIAVTMLLAMMPSTAMAADEVVKTGQGAEQHHLLRAHPE